MEIATLFAIMRARSVGLGDGGVDVASLKASCAVIVFLSDTLVTVVEERVGYMRKFSTVNGGCGCGGGSEQMRRNVDTDCLEREFRDQGAEVFGSHLLAGG